MERRQQQSQLREQGLLQLLNSKRVGRKILILVVALTAAATVLGTLVLAQARNGGSSRGMQTKDAPPVRLGARPAVPSVPPRVAEDFAVLRRPREASDELSRSGRVVVNDADIPNTSGSNGDLARDSRALSGGRRVFVVPGDDSVCLVLDTKGPGGEVAGGGCADLDAARSGRFVRSGYGQGLAGGDNVLVYGLVPDGVSSVKIIDADGKARTVPVKGNVYAATFPDRGRLKVDVGDTSVLAP